MFRRLKVEQFLLLLSKTLREIFMGMIGCLLDGNMMGRRDCITYGLDTMTLLLVDLYREIPSDKRTISIRTLMSEIVR